MSPSPKRRHYCRPEFDPDFEVLVTDDGTKAVFIVLAPSMNLGDCAMIPNHGFVAYERVVPLTEGIAGQPPFAENSGLKPSVRGVTGDVTRHGEITCDEGHSRKYSCSFSNFSL